MDQIIDMYLKQKKSMPQIAKETNLPYNRVRNFLLANNIKMRTRREGRDLNPNSGGGRLKGRKRPPFSEEWKNNMSKGRLLWSKDNAKGITLKPDGYYELTTGVNKGRGEHVVIMEEKIGRHLFINECVHHIDQNKVNNAIENLQLMTFSEHSRLHRQLEKDNNNLRERDKYGKFK